MALWKPFLGSRANLDTVEKHAGYVYWCSDDSTVHFDFEDADGNLQRKRVNEEEMNTMNDKISKIEAALGTYINDIDELIGGDV